MTTLVLQVKLWLLGYFKYCLMLGYQSMTVLDRLMTARQTCQDVTMVLLPSSRKQTLGLYIHTVAHMC